MRGYLETVRDHVVVFDGAMGTSLQAMELSAQDFGGAKSEGWIDGLVLNHPSAVEKVHRSFLEVGCDVVETCTFQANRLRLREWGAGERTVELNSKAAQLARSLCDGYSTEEKPRFVAGSIGPSGFLPSSIDPAMELGFRELVEVFAEQAEGLVDGGSDLLIIETAQDILEVKASIFGARQAFRKLGRSIPIQAQVTLDPSGRMLLGTDIAAACAIIDALGVDVIGLNCSTGPDHMREPIRYLCEHTDRPVACIPNAGLPRNVEGRAVYELAPENMAKTLSAFVTDLGVSVVGGCCGTTPAHIACLVDAVKGKTPKLRTADTQPRIASAMRATEVAQHPAPLLIGERVNSQGSRAMKRLLLADDYEGILQVAREQVEGGAHALDICVALTERADESAQMERVFKSLQLAVEVPLVIDSTEASVVQAALETYPGLPIINSVNLENGRKRCEAILPLVADHGCKVIALTIDETGMAKTAQRKLEVAQRIFQIATKDYGLKPGQLLFDALTFTLATGDAEWVESAKETIAGIELIKQAMPGVFCVLGVSNVSFGLSPQARAPLNSVFLYHCIEAGLDAAIINPAHFMAYGEIDPEVRQLAEDLIFNDKPDALASYIGHFEALVAGPEKPEETAIVLTPAEEIHRHILQRKREGVEALIDEALKEFDPVDLLNQVLLPAMKEVGDKFGAGELILPFVLQSAGVMKRAVAHLEQFLEKREGYGKGKVVLATVYGDVHDIGKNLVNTILSNNGYQVYDLGKQVPINVIVDKAVEVGADAIGLSALLVSTSKQMPLCLQELDARGLEFPVIIGGAAINRPFGRRILYLDEERIYKPGVFYCRDAFEGLETVDQLVEPTAREALQSKIREEAKTNRVREKEKAKTAINSPVSTERSETKIDNPIPKPPFWGPKVLTDIDLDAVYPCIDRISLFKMSWQFRGIRDPERWAKLVKEELEPRLEQSMREAREEGYVKLDAVYGYWPAQSEGNHVIVYDPVDQEKEIARFLFPRQFAEHRLCMADYIRPKSSGEMDLIALQICTGGSEAGRKSTQLQQSGDYDDMLRVHGFATQMAEASAEWLHREIRKELGIAADQGRRYSWGYPACPELSDHQIFCSIVPVQEIGINLTDAYQFVPEHTTAAIVMHHPEARYFAIYAQTAPSEEGALVGLEERGASSS